MKIRVLREAGGLGDIVRCIAPLMGLRRRFPGAEIHMWVPDDYREVVDRAGVVDRFFTAPRMDPIRRQRLELVDVNRRPYLRSDCEYDMTLDLYCPAFDHEKLHPHAVWRDRIELFCEAAGVPAVTPIIPITAPEMEKARCLLRESGIEEKKGWIALQPFSTHPARDWPLSSWKMLAEMLTADGYGVFLLDNQERAKEITCPRIIGRPILQVAAILRAVRLLIGPDSGLAHLSGAVSGMTLGVTASISGPVLYRHYPRHSYIQPDQPGEPCAWPCYWMQRSLKCATALRTPGTTCLSLANLHPAMVRDAAVQLCEDGNGPRLSAAPPAEPPAPETDWLRAVLSVTPHGAPLMDLGGRFSEACRRAGLPINVTLEHSEVLPIARFDNTQARAVLAGNPEYGKVSDWIWDCFRALHIGGILHALPQYGAMLKKQGFRPIEGSRTAFSKVTTWPQTQH